MDCLPADAAACAVSGLNASTTYDVRAAAVKSGVTGLWSSPAATATTCSSTCPGYATCDNGVGCVCYNGESHARLQVVRGLTRSVHQACLPPWLFAATRVSLHFPSSDPADATVSGSYFSDGRPTQQSSTNNIFSSGNAVDGDLGSFMATSDDGSDTKPWWCAPVCVGRLRVCRQAVSLRARRNGPLCVAPFVLQGALSLPTLERPGMWTWVQARR